VVGSDPTAIAITPNGKTAYVVAGDALTPIDVATGKPGNAIKVGKNAVAIAIGP
jgi:DNA-binding beta-propeller fold protein YncE